MHQEVQYCTTPDGVRLAYSRIGKGTPIVRIPHWFAQLEHDLIRLRSHRPVQLRLWDGELPTVSLGLGSTSLVAPRVAALGRTGGGAT